MALDPSIPLGVKGPDPGNLGNMLLQTLQLQDARDTGDMNKLKLSQAQQGMDDQNRLRGVLGLGKSGQELESTLLQNGFFDQALKFGKDRRDNAKTDADTTKTQAETEKIRLEHAQMVGERVSSVMSTAKDPASYVTALQTLSENPIYAGVVSKLPPTYDPARLEAIKAEGMKYKDLLEQKLHEAQQAELGRHNVQTEKAGMITAGAAASNAATARQRLELDSTAPQYVQTDSGLVAVPKRPGAGAIVAQTVTGADGQPLAKPLQNIPASVNTAIISNNQNLNKAKSALTLLQGKNVGSATGDPNATGVKGFVPQTILNWADQPGVDTRAAIADLGSMVLHDRSGAAVTASESPRLLPFIPQATDSAETASKKLKRFIEIFQQEQDALGQTYSKDAGYKPSPVIQGAPGATGGWSIKPKG
jgi:hypothetical protein